jgi:uncharacterized membrane protein (DUF2068 family)
MRRERGLWLIIGYKLAKGGLWLVLAVVILVAMQAGLEHRLLGLAVQLRHHSQAWSIELAELVVRAASRRGMWTIVVALLADGLLSIVEGWALVHGFWWAPWLVVVATGSLLPFEVIALVRRLHVGRAVLFVVNVVIVAYLARRALRDRTTRVAYRGRLDS